MYELLIQRNLRWVGHIHRMDDSRLPKQILYSQLKEGLHGISRLRLWFKDTVKRNLKNKKIFLLVAGNPSAETDVNGET